MPGRAIGSVPAASSALQPRVPAGDQEEQKSLPTLPQDGVVTQAVDGEMLRWPRNSSDTHPGPRKVIFFHMIPTDLW